MISFTFVFQRTSEPAPKRRANKWNLRKHSLAPNKQLKSLLVLLLKIGNFISTVPSGSVMSGST